ncbi:hypothetical protein D3C80_2116220 [compost metagenome]
MCEIILKNSSKTSYYIKILTWSEDKIRKIKSSVMNDTNNSQAFTDKRTVPWGRNLTLLRIFTRIMT